MDGSGLRPFSLMSFDPFTTARRLTNTELVNFSAIPAREKAGRSAPKSMAVKSQGVPPHSPASVNFVSLLSSHFASSQITKHVTPQSEKLPALHHATTVISTSRNNPINNMESHRSCSRPCDTPRLPYFKTARESIVEVLSLRRVNVLPSHQELQGHHNELVDTDARVRRETTRLPALPVRRL